MPYQILTKGKNRVVKKPYIFTELYKIIAEKDFVSMTVERVDEDSIGNT